MDGRAPLKWAQRTLNRVGLTPPDRSGVSGFARARATFYLYFSDQEAEASHRLQSFKTSLLCVVATGRNLAHHGKVFLERLGDRCDAYS